MKTLKLANFLLAAVLLSGVCVGTAKADSFVLVDGDSSVTAIFKVSGHGSATATFSFIGNVLTMNFTNNSSDLNSAVAGLGFDSRVTEIFSKFSSFDGASKWILNNGARGIIEVWNHGNGKKGASAASLRQTTITFTLHDISGNIPVSTSKGHLVRLPGDKPIGCYGCEGSTIPNPEPAGLILMASGLVGISSYLVKRFKKN